MADTRMIGRMSLPRRIGAVARPGARRRRVGASLATALLLPGPALAALADTGASATSGTAAGFGALPPPPERVDADATQAAPQHLELELFVNGLSARRVVPVVRQQGRFGLRVADLREAGLQPRAFPPTSGDTIFVDRLAGVRADYDAPRQQLHLTVSPEYLPSQRLGAKKRDVVRASYDMGALLNYDVYVSGGGKRVPTQASLFHEARIFSAAGIVSTTGALRTGRGKS